MSSCDSMSIVIENQVEANGHGIEIGIQGIGLGAGTLRDLSVDQKIPYQTSATGHAYSAFGTHGDVAGTILIDSNGAGGIQLMYEGANTDFETKCKPSGWASSPSGVEMLSVTVTSNEGSGSGCNITFTVTYKG